MKEKLFSQKYILTVSIFAVVLSIGTFFLQKNMKLQETPKAIAQKYDRLTHTTALPTLPTPVATSAALPPSQRELTLAEKNALYGPCAYVPTLMYHHVQDLNKAKELGHAQLTVDVNIFRKQMEYLKNNGYRTISMQDLINFFDQKTPLPSKPILLTFDDGYDDFATDVSPIIKELGFNATNFIPTGLINNFGYMNWGTMSNLGSGNFYFANHTWSHRAMAASNSTVDKEITTADIQLKEHGFNASKVFAYPYGSYGTFSEQFLASYGYKLAFTTNRGSILCKGQRFTLPRVRIGNGPLNSYGL